MIQGVFGGKISLLAGIVPPAKGEISLDVKYSDKLHLPPGFKGYFDYEEAKRNAIIENKPLFIDFTGHGCFNCRLMEENVWPDPNVKKILDEDYIIVALYVDDRTPLTDDDKYKTLGKKNFALQMDKFCSNAQPYYVLLDPRTEKKLSVPKAYDTDIQNFIDFLNEGKNNFITK
jgi:thiol:disulfide interchange protein DsbD